MSENVVKIVKRRRRRGKKVQGTEEEQEKARLSRMYFTADTQAAIVRYQLEGDYVVRNKIYLTEIAPAFDKLVENLINIHKFSSAHDTYEMMKSDCVCFLYEILNKFDPNRGTAAFSYFNVCAKNWLIIRTKHKSQSTRKFLSLDDPDALTLADHNTVEEHSLVQSQDVLLENKRAAVDILDKLHEVRRNVSTENELSTINNIITLFERIDDVDIVSKGAMNIILKDMTGLSHKQLTTAIATIKRLYTD